jgi:hypothetical protein
MFAEKMCQGKILLVRRPIANLCLAASKMNVKMVLSNCI